MSASLSGSLDPTLENCTASGAGPESGAPAAKAYCQAHGYSQVESFGEAVDIGNYTKTKVFSSGQVCNDPSCDGFSYIACKK